MQALTPQKFVGMLSRDIAKGGSSAGVVENHER